MADWEGSSIPEWLLQRVVQVAAAQSEPRTTSLSPGTQTRLKGVLKKYNLLLVGIDCGRPDCGHGGCRLNHRGHSGRVDETKEHFASGLVHCHWGEDGLGKRKDDGKSQTGGMSK